MDTVLNSQQTTALRTFSISNYQIMNTQYGYKEWNQI